MHIPIIPSSASDPAPLLTDDDDVGQRKTEGRQTHVTEAGPREQGSRLQGMQETQSGHSLLVWSELCLHTARPAVSGAEKSGPLASPPPVVAPCLPMPGGDALSIVTPSVKLCSGPLHLDLPTFTPLHHHPSWVSAADSPPPSDLPRRGAGSGRYFTISGQSGTREKVPMLTLHPSRRLSRVRACWRCIACRRLGWGGGRWEVQLAAPSRSKRYSPDKANQPLLSRIAPRRPGFESDWEAKAGQTD